MNKLAAKYNLMPKTQNDSAALSATASVVFSETVRDIEVLSVVPHVGMGTLKLGMSPEQIYRALSELIVSLNLPVGSKLDVTRRNVNDEGTVVMRYQIDSLFFMVRYEKDVAVEISVDRGICRYIPVVLFHHEVFSETAQQLITELKSHDECIFDSDDELLGTEYLFPATGIRLWREEAFHPKLLLDEQYMEAMKLVIDEMLQYEYFEIITVK